MGEALLVSVGAEGLFRLSAAPLPADALELRGAAAASARLAQRLVTRDLPLYDDLARLHRGVAFRAAPFAIQSGGAPPTALDGSSYGLPLSLAIASNLLRLPLPADLCSTGALQVDGSVAAVQGLRRKVALLVGEAPDERRGHQQVCFAVMKGSARLKSARNPTPSDFAFEGSPRARSRP